METAMNVHPFARLVLSRMLPLLLAFGGAATFAQNAADPPARVASLSQIEGSVVFAPAGETEWLDARLNRPVTRGDRLWTDRGARAEVHLGSAVLHMDGQTFLDVVALDDDVLQASLNEGSVNARVRELARGENFEVDTPQLAFRASQPGDYRIDVDPAQATTRVTVRSGAVLVYGANGQSQELAGGQVVTFAGRDLERVAVQATPADDAFDRWAADRNRAEDQSIAARYVPREVVGYQQLDPYGTWAQDASYGAVWYPRVTVADWAPYRYGHWEWISPWGWTWIDDAPWGFAPFHYGRWAMIGARWCWVPGRIGPRPVYSPALVVFLGGGGVNFSLSIGSGPGIGWFPLGPGEAWRPYYRTSPVYVTNVNRYIVVNNQTTNYYVNQRHPGAVTAVAMEDFSRGRPVHRHWQPLKPADLGRAQVLAQPALPQPRRFVDSRPARTHALPPPQLSAAPVAVQPRSAFPGPGASRREAGESRHPIAAPRPQEVPRPQVLQEPRGQQERQIQQQARQEDRQRRDEQRALDEQRRQQVQQERVQREQQTQERVQRDQQVQERAQRQQQAAQERAMRQQQAAQEHAVRQQQAAQEHAQRQQQQERAAARQHPQPQPQVVAPQAQQQQQQQQQPPAREHRGRDKAAPEQRDDNRSQGGDEGWRGRGHGRAG